MKKGIIAAALVIAIAIIGVAIYGSGALQHNGPTQSANTPAQQPTTNPAQTTEQHHTASSEQTPPPEQNKPSATSATNDNKLAGSPAERYCADGHDKSDTQAITRAGGLVQIFQHEGALADAYGCATAYLDNGGKVNAVDPRSGSDHLTPLLFAIKRNDPKMVHFMLDHGADPHERGGPQKIKPYGYAVFQALHHRSTDYNTVINILDSALGDHPASSNGS
ncbi:MAG: ankyrin repeat domain-containing protein [Salinisphaera sp.]|uniref:hypothetical protein n=1 Tax=Salinisphaera sp. TaxID=1914330 RepID=UPI003C798E59